MKYVGLFALLFGVSQIGFAVEAQRPYIHDDDLSAERIVHAAARIRAALASPGAPELGTIEKSKLDQVLNQLVALYGGDARPRHSRAASLQQQANMILIPRIANNDSGNDVVCQRVIRVGTRIPDVECRTRAVRAREQAAAAETISRLQTACDGNSREALCSNR